MGIFEGFYGSDDVLSMSSTYMPSECVMKKTADTIQNGHVFPRRKLSL
jgi:hypothetical protein